MTKCIRGHLLGLVAGLAAAALSASSAGALTPVPAAPPAQAQLDAFAHQLGYRFTVLTNQDPHGFVSRVDLTLPQALPQVPWSIYIGVVNRVQSSDSDQFDITHVNGDLYRLSPKPGASLRPGETYGITLHAEGHFFSEYHILPNAYVAAEGLKARTIDAARPHFDPATRLESLPFMADMTDEAKLAAGFAAPNAKPDVTQWLTPERAFLQNAQRRVGNAAPDIVILPTPVSARRLGGAVLDLNRGIAVKLAGAALPAVQAALDGLHLKRSAKGVPVDIAVTGQGAAESYQLRAQRSKVVITAADSAGAAYALASLAQQAAFEHNHLKPLEITDAPRLRFRGLLLDLARNFESKGHILKIIDLMGQYKLNRLHLHLGDDEGWRLAIAGLPELTEIGSKRCHDPSEDHCLMPQLGAGPDGGSKVDGFLTRADYIEILKAAKARHIEVIPSFDMPGHSRAAMRSMEARARRLIAEGQPEAAAEFRLQDPGDTTVYDSVQHYHDNTLNICMPSTYHFIEKVIDSIKSMHDEAGLPLKVYHIGTDETAGAWTGSPACQALMSAQHMTVAQLGAGFITKVSQMLASRGIEPAGWSDGVGSVDPAQMPNAVQSNNWGGLFTGGVASAHRQANQGWDVVMSTPEILYFDMPFSANPKERGNDWASRGTDLFKVFSFMPENLPANASIMTDIHNQGQTITDETPLNPGHRIAGMQGQLWSEVVRGEDVADLMLFPRTLALAERAWHAGAWEPAYRPGHSYAYQDGQVDEKVLLADWRNFNDRLTPRLAALDAAGIIYRLPTPGARVTGGVLEANLAYGDLKIEYRTGKGQWMTYRGPVEVSGPVELRSVAPTGGRFSRTVVTQ